MVLLLRMKDEYVITSYPAKLFVMWFFSFEDRKDGLELCTPTRPTTTPIPSDGRLSPPLAQNSKAISLRRSSLVTTANVAHAKHLREANSRRSSWVNRIRDSISPAKPEPRESAESDVPFAPGKQGLLLMRTGDVRTGTWKERLFVVKDGLGSTLNYYHIKKKSLQLKPKKLGKINLCECEIVDYHHPVHSREHVFSLSPATSSRSYLLSTETAKEKEDWVSILKIHTTTKAKTFRLKSNITNNELEVPTSDTGQSRSGYSSHLSISSTSFDSEAFT